MANNKPIGVAYADPALDSYQVGTSGAPVTATASGNITQLYASTTHASGDLRGYYSRVDFAGAGGGETIRAFSRVTAAQGAGQTTNGAHISLSVNSGGSISGAANALRATLGVATGVTPGGTLAAIQVDSDFPSSVTLPGSAAFLRFTNSGSGSVDNLVNVPAAMVVAKGSSTGFSHVIKMVDSAGATYYLMATNSAP